MEEEEEKCDKDEYSHINVCSTICAVATHTHHTAHFKHAQ